MPTIFELECEVWIHDCLNPEPLMALHRVLGVCCEDRARNGHALAEEARLFLQLSGLGEIVRKCHGFGDWEGACA